MSNKILFYDNVTPHKYAYSMLETQPMGGTEATVLRVSEGLKAKGYDVTLFNHTEDNTLLTDYKPNAVITLRDAGHYMANKKRWPGAKHYLWLHDIVSGPYQQHLQHHLNGQEGTLLTVSEFHKTNTISALNEVLKQGKIRVKRVYNPLADYCIKIPNQAIDNNKLVYFSSPHKGLDYVLKLFQYVRNIDSKFTLTVANPGYYSDKKDLPEGVINVGSLNHKEVVDQVRSSLCVFYPNISFPETFGLVYAEANAVGTPVLAHPIGAAREVLSHPHETMDCRHYKEVVDRVIKWSKGERPIVSARKEFRLETVISEWVRLINL